MDPANMTSTDELSLLSQYLGLNQQQQTALDYFL